MFAGWLPAHHEKQIRGQHGKPTWVQGGQQPGGERQTDQAPVHGQDASAAIRPDSSCGDIAEVGLLTNVELPSER